MIVKISPSYLEHHGIKGQKWGVRRYQNRDGSLTAEGRKRYSDSSILQKSGEKVALHKIPTPITAKFLAQVFPSIKKNQENFSDYTIKDLNGKTVGNITTNKDTKETLNIVWLGINTKNEGKGLGTSAMRTVIDDAKKQGMRYITLEVPTTSPNARHIYEKLGFKETGKLGSEDDVWGGLTKMRLEL